MTKYELVGRIMSLGSYHKGGTPKKKRKAKDDGVELLNEYLALNIPCVTKAEGDLLPDISTFFYYKENEGHSTAFRDAANNYWYSESDVIIFFGAEAIAELKGNCL
jgi:hypothetical protein